MRGAGRRPIAAAGGSICYSHGRDSRVARPAQPPQPGDQPQVRPRCSPRAVATAAAALTWRCGPPAGFLTSPSAGSRVRLSAEQQARKKKASAEARQKSPHLSTLPQPQAGCKTRTPRFYCHFHFLSPSHAADSQVYAFFSDYFNDLLFLGTSRWLCTPESGKKIGGRRNADGERGGVGTRGRGAGRALELDWVSVDFTLQITRRPPLLSSHDYIPVKRCGIEGA